MSHRLEAGGVKNVHGSFVSYLVPIAPPISISLPTGFCDNERVFELNKTGLRMPDAGLNGNDHAGFQRTFGMRSFVSNLVVMSQAGRFVADQAHAMGYEPKALPEPALSSGFLSRFVRLPSRSTRCNYSTCLILDKANFIEKILH